MPLDSMTRRTALAAGSAGFVFACSGHPESTAESPISSGRWRTGPTLPFAVQEIYPALHNGKIHLAGGFIAEDDSISGATDRHVIFDPASGVWTSGTPLQSALHHPQIISFKKHLVMAGGFASISEEAAWQMQSGCRILVDFSKPPSEGTFPTDKILLPPIDIREVWWPIEDLPKPNAESVAGVLGENLHICGGRTPSGRTNSSWNDHLDTRDHYVLNDWADAWTRAAPLPTARNSAASAVIGGKWHVVGGRTVAGGNVSTHEFYDPSEDRWYFAAPMPQGQGGLAAAGVGDRLYAFGGEFFNNGGGVYSESWMYEPATDTWVAIPDMPHPRHGLGAVTVGNEIYVIGGALEVGGSKTSNLVEIFTPSA